MKQRLIIAALALSVTLPATAADWTMVVQDRTRRIEIDRDSVLQSDPGTKVAWGRIVLSQEDAAEAGYSTVKALNRYDCKARSFATVKRVYLDDASRVIREERVVEQRPIQVNPRSVDERLWREVCNPPKAMDIAALADVAGKAAAEVAQENPVRHADVASLDERKLEPLRTADNGHGDAAHGDTTHGGKIGGGHEAPAPAHDEVRPGSAQPGHEMVTEGKIELPFKPKGAARPAAETQAADNHAPAETLAAPAHAAESHAPAAPSAHAEAKPKVPAAAHAKSDAHAPAADHAPVVKKAAPKTTHAVASHAEPVKKVVHKAPPKPKASTQGKLLKVAMKDDGPANPDDHGAAPAKAHQDFHWSYEGLDGPDRWGKMNPAWSTCDAGKRQSPIDIRDGIGVDLEPIKFDYVPTYFRILNNGHTVQVTVGMGSRMSVMGRDFDLVQFHFHRPSEERVNGRGFEMVAHLVHKDLDGRLAVVAVLIERGSAHQLIQTLWNNLPLEQGHDYAPEATIDPVAILPSDPAYYTYMGSMTTPPCSEDVLWMVMKQPIQLSPEQIAIFARLYPNNARPIQQGNGRLIKASR